MKIEKIIKELEMQFPLSLAEEWDNPGLQVGSTEKNVKKIIVALDATDAVLAKCVDWGADLLITHHPLLLSGIRQINNDSMHGRKILTLAEHGIAHYAMHTNYDVAKMAELAEHALKLKKCRPLEVTGRTQDGAEYGIGRIGELPEKMTAEECCEYVKKVFKLENVRLFGSREQQVKRAAVCPGSGKSLIGAALAGNAQLFITGDIGHHDGLDAVDQGLVIIDAGHYGVEKLFIPQVTELLQKHFPELKVKAVQSGQPFEVL